MNNLEKLTANGGAELAAFLAEAVPCQACPAFDFCAGAGETPGTCKATLLAWFALEAPEPDTWEKIEADAKRSYCDYWKCDETCDNCPAKFPDGRAPWDHYGVGACFAAKNLDIVRRCKELAGVCNV